MNVKKLLSMVTAGMLAVTALAGCAGKTATDGTASKTDSDKTYKIGLIQLVQHEALDAATEGFKEVLTEKLGDKVEFDYQNASGDSTTCATIAGQFVSSKVDLIFANATPALQAAYAATPDIPIVGTSITDYATALEIDDWTGKTGYNVTGSSDLAPLAEQAEMFKELLPDVKKIGLLYCSAEANSNYQVEIVADELEKLGYEAKAYSFADSNDVSAVTTAACGEVDALYIPTDNTAASNAEIIDSVASSKNIPIIAGESGICQGCGIATLSISYTELGRIAGEMAYDILVNGKNPGDMDIKFATAPTKMYVADRCKALGIEVPDTYEALEAE